MGYVFDDISVIVNWEIEKRAFNHVICLWKSSSSQLVHFALIIKQF